MNYTAIKKNDIANGVGIRVSLFVSGCRHHCKNCFNKEAWDFNYGALFTDDVINELIEAADHDYVNGLSLLGGEPFESENREGLIRLAEKFRSVYPHKDIWCYTGFTFEELLSDDIKNPENAKNLLGMIDVLVDGKFVEELKSPALLFRGSSNQRIIDVKKSLECKKVVLLEGKWERAMGSDNIYDV